ncbi:diguanylate cyclase [Planococcus chinensis]|uniref:Diguanylate cyclase n=1 Tax=Planococcus chinensis TaxID=272917 RepID=A0ABW4QH04_9BACL
MDALLFFFLENMALIIALMYLGLRAKEALLIDLTNPIRDMWMIALFVSFLTFSIMYNAFPFEGMRLDLREVPIYFISFAGGWQFGILSAIFPIAYRGYMGGPTVMLGIIQAIILPIIIGSLFHDRKTIGKPIILLNLRRMMLGFFVFETIKSVWMLVTTPATPLIILAMFLFATIAVLSMALILNGENRNLILRKELEFYSNQDPMTHLPNIRFFKNNINRLVAQKEPLAIVMLDVDYFKVYNDTHGHQKGDAVLRSIAQIMKDSTRKTDFVARYGGEEFIICLADPENAHEALRMAESVRQNIEDFHFEGEALQPEGKLTVSMGISFSDGHKPLDHLIEEADNALYQSKRQGRNRVTIFQAAAS